MSDELIKRPFDEEFDTVMEVERNPTGAWVAIQEQAVHIEELEDRLTKAVEALRFISQMHGYTSRQLSDLARTTLAELEKPNDI